MYTNKCKRQTAQGGYTGTVGRKEPILREQDLQRWGGFNFQDEESKTKKATLVFNQAFNEKIIK